MPHPLSTIVQRAIAAEVRAVEEGHHAFWSDQLACFTVKSDTRHGVTYQVRPAAIVAAPGAPVSLRFSCSCIAGRTSRTLLPCKHGALVARRLERMGLAQFDGGTWRPLGALLDAAVSSSPRPVAPPAPASMFVD